MRLLRESRSYRASLSTGWGQLRRAPVSAAITVLVQAIGIAGMVLIFALVIGVRQRRPGGILTSSDELVQIREVAARSIFGPPSLGSFSYPNYLALRQHAASLSDVAASIGMATVAVQVHQGLEVVEGGLSTSNYLSVLGVRPVLGRGFTAEEDLRVVDAICLLSERLVRRWGLEGRVPGATLVVKGRPVTIVGVLPEAFGGTNYVDRAEIWFPIALHEFLYPGYEFLSADHAPFQLVGRLKPGVARRAAEEESTMILRRDEHRGGAETPASARVAIEPLRAAGHIERYLFMPLYAALSLSAGLILAMALFNVAGLEMVMAVKRQRDVAIRLVLGASPGGLMLERLSEALLLGVLAGGVGVLLARGLLEVLRGAITGRFFTLLIESASLLNWRMPAFVLLVSTVVALVSRLLPAWAAAKTPPALVLQGSGGLQSQALRMRARVLIGQTAVVTLLIFISTASARGTWKAQNEPLGFDTRGLALAKVDPVAVGYEPSAALDLTRRLLEQLNSAVNVQTATLSRFSPVNRATVTVRIALVDQKRSEVIPVGSVSRDEVAENYFGVMGIPVIQGRSFDRSDVHGSAPVLVINSTAARQWPWPSGQAVGGLVRLGSETTPYTVVGVVGDVSPIGAPGPLVYLPLFQRASGSIFDHFGFMINVRTLAKLGATNSSLRAEVLALDPKLPVADLRPIGDVIADSLPLERTIARLNATLAALALVICAVGFYAAASRIALERKREFAVRLALGARPADVTFLLLKWWSTTIGTGLALGLISGTALVWPIAARGVLLSVDLVVVAIVCTIVLAVGLAALCVPAWSVLRTDPAATLRLQADTR